MPTRCPPPPRHARGAPRVWSAGVRRVRVGLAAAAGASGLAACDPCAGIVGCSQPPRLGVSGQIIDRGTPTDADRDPLSGAGIPQVRPVRGVRVEVTPTGGVGTGAAPGAATTDANGWWQVSLPVREEGVATVDVRVTPPGGVGYAVRGLALRASGTRGQGNVLGRWTRDLYLTMVGELYDAPSGAPVDGASITAVRRGGIAIEPTANTRSPMVTFGGGRFLYDVRPLADGPLLLDFVIERAGLPPATVRGVTVFPKHEWLPPNVDGELVFRLDRAGNRVANRAGG